MDPEKAAFVAEADPQEPDDDLRAGTRSALREVIVRQIADDDPPEVWSAARRQLGAGMSPPDVMRQLVLAMLSALSRAADAERSDQGGYADALARLPLPSAGEVEQVHVDVVRDRQPIGADDLDRLVADRLRLPLEDPLTETLLDQVQEHLLADGGPLAMLSPDRLVHVPSLLDGVVLTHRLTATEREFGMLYAADLPGFARIGLRHRDGLVLDSVGEDDRSRWHGPPGWLQALPPELVAVRVAPDGEVSVIALDEEPEAPPELVSALRAAYDAAVEEPWLPVSGEDLLVGVLATDRSAFARPAPPLTELAAAAGLEQRGDEYAHDESVWEQARILHRHRRLHDLLGPGLARAADDVLQELDAGVEDPAAARRVLRELYHPDVLEVVPDELLGVDDDAGLLAAFTTLAHRLLAAASRPDEQAVARWLVTLACERRGEVAEAESHLRAAVRADPDWPCAQDRLAWYEADRGDAAGAAARWRGLGVPPDQSPDLAEVERFAAMPTGVTLGRNQPCWCGSGRKYKVCHLNRPVRAPLPDRVGWLCRKAVAYLERRGGGVRERVLDHAAARADDPDDPEALAAALEDPLVLDALLHEGGWFERFLADRGPLLPDDEALLARAWTLVERSVCEVVDVEPGSGLTVRDLRTGDRFAVRERSFSRQARAGDLVCARVVPDGESHQFIGGLFRVAPGTETELLERLDDGDGYELLHYVAGLHRPPTLTTTDGEPLLDCRAELDVPDPAAARDVLSRRCEEDGDGWVWSAEAAGDGPRTVRAWLGLDGGTLTVRTMSEARLDAVLAELATALPDAVPTRDERRPFEPGDGPAVRSAPVEVPPEVLGEIQDRLERRWCDEHVPALGGRTPREAADDPTRRDELARLIASFPDLGPASGAFGLRPARLRELLGLEVDA